MVEDTLNLMTHSRQQIELCIFFIRDTFLIQLAVFEILSVFWKLGAKKYACYSFHNNIGLKLCFLGQGIHLNRFQDLINKIVLLAMAIGGIVQSVTCKIGIGAAYFAGLMNGIMQGAQYVKEGLKRIFFGKRLPKIIVIRRYSDIFLSCFGSTKCKGEEECPFIVFTGIALLHIGQVVGQKRNHQYN